MTKDSVSPIKVFYVPNNNRLELYIEKLTRRNTPNIIILYKMY